MMLKLLSFVFLIISCVVADYITGPGGMLLNTACHVELPAGASAFGQDRVVLADGTVVPYPVCDDLVNTTEVARPARDATNRKREANGWNVYSYYYPGFVMDQFNGDWVVPGAPGVGYVGQLLYYFTALEPSGYDPILQPVVWYGISPAGGGSAWFAAVWEVHANNAFTTSQVVQVYPGQAIHTTMVRTPGSAWSCNMYANGNFITGANFEDNIYQIAFVSLEIYNAADCASLPFQTTTTFYNMQIQRDGAGYVSPIAPWTGVVAQSDCGQSVSCSGDGSQCSLSYGVPAILSPLIFDAGTYKNLNPDLPWSDAADLQNHWINNGVYEGRQAAAAFAVSDYKWTYGDLAPLPNNVAILHYATNGYSEGRAGKLETNPLAFDWVFYLNTYSDLLAAFGYNRFSAENHWVSNGIYEGRYAIASFSAPAYLSFYPDLQAAFGNNYDLATRHWVTNGHAEGRRGI